MDHRQDQDQDQDQDQHHSHQQRQQQQQQQQHHHHHHQQQQQQQQNAHSNINASWSAQPHQLPQPLPAPLNPPVFEPLLSQLPMNLARDDPGDGMTIDTASDCKATTDSVWSFESVRDIHEFIREFNGRHYNAQNTTYFLPAGQSLSIFPPSIPSFSPTSR